MNRRAFLRLVGLGAAAVALPSVPILGSLTDASGADPERLLWTPGAKRIYDLGAGRRRVVVDLDDEELDDLSWDDEDWTVDVEVGPSYESGRLNHLLTADWIAKEALLRLKNNLSVMAQINREYDTAFQGATIGAAVNVSKPVRYRG